MAFLGQMVLVSQPIVLSYRSSTLYGAAEQAVGGAAAVASLSIASIIGPQVRCEAVVRCTSHIDPTNN